MKVKIALHWQMAIALLLGGLGGWLLGDYIAIWGKYIDVIGEVFLNALKAVALPLVFFSTFLSVSSMTEAKTMGRVAIKVFFYFIITAIVAALIGVFITNILRFGVGNGSYDTGLTLETVSEKSFFSKWYMVGIVFFALISGFFATRIPNFRRQAINNLFSKINDFFLRLAATIVRFAPIGIFAVVMTTIGANTSSIGNYFVKIVLFITAVWVALIVMGCIILPFMVGSIAHISPIKHIRQISSALLVAFSTSSSYGALPLILSDTKDKCGVSDRITGFTIPLGITFNKIGTIIYECVAVIFVAQAFDVTLTAVQQVSLIGMVIVTVLGAPAMPMAGAVVLAVLLKSMNLPDAYIQLFMAVDILCDMPKTLLNAYSICCGAVIVAKSEGEKLKV